jgi:hypothetical protein
MVLPEPAERLMSFDGGLAFVPRGSDRLLHQDPGGPWVSEAPPKAFSGEGAWETGEGRFYYLQLRPAFVWTRAVTETDWHPFLAEDEELENPVALSSQGKGLAVLNRDPAEVVVFDGQGKSIRRFELTRSKLWPLQRPVFESPLDYIRPRHCDTPRKLWAREDGRLAVLFTTQDGTAPRLVSLDPGPDEAVTLKEGLLALRADGLKRKAALQDLAFLPDGRTVLTSNLGGLWLYDPNLRLTREWENLPMPPPSWARWGKALTPWLLLVGFLLSLLASAWPKDATAALGVRIPRRAWAVGAASLVIPGLGQGFLRRWGWSWFWVLWAVGWGVLALFLTLRLKKGGFVTPATYIESLLAFSSAWLGSAFQAFYMEWRRGGEGKR